MAPDEMKKTLWQIYYKALSVGLCTSKADFADVIGIARSSLSAAMNSGGKSLTDSLIKKVTIWAKLNGLDNDAKPEPQPQRSVIIPEETLELYNNLSETCRNLSALLMQYQAAGAVPMSVGTAPKNFPADPFRK